ncbi:hypothetical protein B0H19DRAFT_1183564 [Mycena capillaripes]|nr:hypothetical protein B0H19DRAFT_1183564 [Mycena capillaripes]
MFHRYSVLSLSPLFRVLIFILSLHILPPPIAVSALPPRLARHLSAGGSPSDHSAQHARQTDCMCHPFAVPPSQDPATKPCGPDALVFSLPHFISPSQVASSKPRILKKFRPVWEDTLPQFIASLLGEACASVSHCQVYPALQSTQHLSDDHVCERDRFQRTYVECFSPSK